MLGTLYVVLSSSKEEDYQKVKKELLEIYPDFSVSPYKESQMEKDAVEFFATCQITKEKAKEVLDQLNNDWDGEVDDCIAYGFNTKMFDSLVYHLNFNYTIKMDALASILSYCGISTGNDKSTCTNRNYKIWNGKSCQVYISCWIIDNRIRFIWCF